MTGRKRTEDKIKNFEELMVYQESVFRICLGFSKNPWDAEDLTQDVYLKAFQKIGSLRDSRLMREWLFRITRNTCLDHSRKKLINRLFKLRSRNESEEGKTPEAEVAHREQLLILKKTITKLNKKHREVFVLREYGHLSYREIAATLGIKEGTVMSRLNRGREAVIHQMKGEIHERQKN
jgi:RNA polymerase sigma-70 factor (ECF subfamily)